MPASASETYNELCRYTRETALLETVESVLNWDERTYMPPTAAEFRAEQLTTLAGQVHRRRTDARLGEWLAALTSSPLAADRHSESGTTIRQLQRDFEKQSKLPQKLVEELVRTTSLAQTAWVEARKKNDFPGFRSWLEKIFYLKRQQAECLGYTTCPYDALLDDYEMGALATDTSRVLSQLRAELVPLVNAIGASSKKSPVEILSRHYPQEAQRLFGEQAAREIGFSFSRGRLDITHHPFCTSLGPNDCRITTRYDERFFPSAFFGILHEAGHGIYDQGLRHDQFGLPPGSAVSLGIHESQSRMWENLVGRSRAFWQYFFPQAAKAFPAALAGVSLDDFYFAINNVQPSLIRVEADEATYNLHIIVRFELEQDLLSDTLRVADLPTAWNDKYREYLGIVPDTDADGVLQDVHWSAGLIGYFPTYSLGNLYAGQLFHQAGLELGDLSAQFARGEFGPLKNWLNTKIHAPGQCYTAAELCQRVTGKPLDPRHLMNHLRGKFGPLYGVS